MYTEIGKIATPSLDICLRNDFSSEDITDSLNCPECTSNCEQFDDMCT